MDEVQTEPDILPGSEHILQWFWEINSQRQPGMSGPCPVGWREVGEWERLTGTITRPDEVRCLVAMDSAYRKAVDVLQERNKQIRESRKGKR